MISFENLAVNPITYHEIKRGGLSEGLLCH